MLANNTVDLNDTLTCSAVGFPVPEFYWINVTSEIVTDSVSIVMPTLGIQHLICLAYNEIRGELLTVKLDVDVFVTG